MQFVAFHVAGRGAARHGSCSASMNAAWHTGATDQAHLSAVEGNLEGQSICIKAPLGKPSRSPIGVVIKRIVPCMHQQPRHGPHFNPFVYPREIAFSGWKGSYSTTPARVPHLPGRSDPYQLERVATVWQLPPNFLATAPCQATASSTAWSGLPYPFCW